MSPHAVLPPSPTSYHSDMNTPEMEHGVNDQSNGHQSLPAALLQRYDDDEIHDLVCVGFGPASLAIAIALQDAMEAGDPLTTTRPKVRFLERQAAFAWHAGMLLPGAKMQISFVKDLATLRNPRSEFSFLNYLHHKGRLSAFTNLATFLPARIEFEDYMRWCSSHFDDLVDYGRDVQSVDVGKTNPRTGAVEYFQVKSRDIHTGNVVTQRARHVVMALGGKPNIPKCLNANHPRVIHSSQYATTVSKIFPPGTQPRSVAVIGAGQSAAEIFHNIPSRFPGTKAYLLMRGSALRPSDDSPFVNEVFDPERIDDIYSQDPTVRAAGITSDKATNYGVVRLELLEEIYSTMYLHRIQHAREEDWPQRIFPHRNVTGMVERVGPRQQPAIELQIDDDSGTYSARKSSQKETLEVDLVVVASGYRRDAHVDMMQGLNGLRSPGQESFVVGREYNVEFAPGKVAPGAGVWLQGCNEKTHGLSDTLLSILAIRGGEMVQSIFGPGQVKNGPASRVEKGVVGSETEAVR